MIFDKEAKIIIDNHISINYDYYKRVCNKYFKGSYLAEDMLHMMYESFLKVKPDVIKHFNSVGKLQNIGGRILMSLYNKRNQGTKNSNKSTSDLHDIPCVTYDIYITDYSNFLENDTFISNHRKKEIKEPAMDCSLVNQKYGEGIELENVIDKMERSIRELLRDGETWFNTQVFIQCQEISILELSKRTKISRAYLTRAYRKGNELLLKELT